MQKITKAIIPAAGFGTRFLPATKSQPKEMLPVVDKPTIQYIVEEAVESGIEDILIVIGRYKSSIEDHFDRSVELEMELEKKIATPAFSTPAKGMFQVKEGNDINLFYVNELGQKTTKAKIAVLARTVDATSRTHAELYNKMKQFIVDNNTIEKLEAEAANNGYVVMTAKNLDINATEINNVKKAREVVRWIFENKEGAISDIFEVEDKIIAVAVDKHNEEGYRSIESVRPQLLSELRKEKKGDILVFRPSVSKGFSRLEKDLDKIGTMYADGYEQASKRIDEIEKFFRQ